MRRVLFALLLAASCLLPAASWAATAYLAFFDTAVFAWDAPSSGGTPTEYRVKVGSSPGVYTQTTVVAYPTTEVTVSTAVPGSGRWYAAVTAANEAGESGPSNEIVLIAGSSDQLGATESIGSRKGKKVQERLGIRRKLTP